MLATVIGIVVALSLVAALAFRMCADTELRQEVRSAWTVDATAGFCIVVMLGFLAIRSMGFGVDTAAYAGHFAGHCRGSLAQGLDASYVTAIFLIDLGMLGACKVSLLPAAWAGLVVGITLLAFAPLRMRFRFAALLLLSMVGIELTTNALRQGLSVALFVVAVSYWPRYWIVSVFASLLAAVLHTSSLLVMLAFGLAWLGWPGFLLGSILMGVLVILGLMGSAMVSIAAPLIFEISKYIAHENDEIYARILVAGCLLALLASPWLACRTRADRKSLYSRREMGVALRLSCTAIPFMFLPYFGYRYVYGIWPLVLWLTVRAFDGAGESPVRHFLWTAVLNLALLLVWGVGSSYMRQVPFMSW